MNETSIFPRLRDTAFQLAAVFAQLAIGIPGIVIAFANDLANRWWVAALTTLFIAISVVFTFSRGKHSRPVIVGYLLVESALTVTLLVLNPSLTFYILWFYVLTIEAMMAFSRREGIAWLIGFVILTIISLGVLLPTVEMLISLPIYLGGFFFFATFANATYQANQARKESQRLLEELQTAHARLQEYALKAEQLAVSEERNRLSREMHDTIGHRLTVASVQLEGVQKLVRKDPEKAETMAEVVREQVREALAELRGTVATLREPLEADLPLDSSLRKLVDDYEAATGLDVHLVLPEEIPDLTTAHRLSLYRTAQEALTNIQKHAGAENAWVHLGLVGNVVTLRVSDDGVGPDMGLEDTGFGLRGIRERAGQIGGDVQISGRRGGGTEVSLQLPLDA